MFAALLLAGGLVPLAAMLVSLFAAAWLRQTTTKSEAQERLPRPRR